MVVEGQISDVVDYGDGNGTMTVMGIVIEIPEGVPIATPTAVLTMAQFADARSLPGRRQPGFVGAAATVEGYFGNTGTLHAVMVEVEHEKPL